MLAGLGSAALTGLMVTLITGRMAGYAVRGAIRLLRHEWVNLAWIGVIDALGAAVLFVWFWALWPSRYEFPIDLANGHPRIFWAFLGLVGPLISAGLLKRAPAGVELPTPNGDPVGLAEYRRHLVKEACESARQYSQHCVVAREDWLKQIALDWSSTGALRFDDLKAQVERELKDRSKGDVKLDHSYFKIIGERERFGTDEPLSITTDQLIRWCIRNGFLSSVASVSHVDLADFPGEFLTGTWRARLADGAAPDPDTEFEKLDSFEIVDGEAESNVVDQ